MLCPNLGPQAARGTAAHDRYLATAAAIQGLLSDLRTANRGLDFVLYGGPVTMPPAYWYSGRPIGSGSDAENREIIQNQMDRPEVAAILDLVVINCAEFYPSIDQHTPVHWRAAIASLSPLGTKAGFIMESQFESKSPDAAPAGWNVSSTWAPAANRHNDGYVLAETTSWPAITAGIMETIEALYVWVGGWMIPNHNSPRGGMFWSARPVCRNHWSGVCLYLPPTPPGPGLWLLFDSIPCSFGIFGLAICVCVCPHNQGSPAQHITRMVAQPGQNNRPSGYRRVHRQRARNGSAMPTDVSVSGRFN